MGRKTGPKSEPMRCDMCGGSGSVPVSSSDHRKGDRSCKQCGGKGTYPFAAMVAATAALLASLLLTGCDPAEDDPAFDCRVHGNKRCTP